MNVFMSFVRWCKSCRDGSWTLERKWCASRLAFWTHAKSVTERIALQRPIQERANGLRLFNVSKASSFKHYHDGPYQGPPCVFMVDFSKTGTPCCKLKKYR